MLKDIISPKYCLSCLNYNKYFICENCCKNLDFDLKISCVRCDLRLTFGSKCIYKHSKSIRFLISFGSYENKVLKNLIIEGKNGAFEIFIDLGEIISEKLKNLNFKDYFITYVPVTKKKLLERGFNQAEILGETISKKLNIPIYNGLIKVKDTKDQAELSYEERVINLKNAFYLKTEPPKKLILVDDIKTTGSTLIECAETLKKGGSKEIIGLVVLK